MKYSDFLFEIGVEELPSKAVLSLSNGLAVNIKAGFEAAKIEHGEILSFGAPRRIAVIVKNVAHLQAMQTISRRGPAVVGSMDTNNNPMPSLLGFAKSCNVDVSALTTLKTDKGEWWLYEACIAGAISRDVILSITQEAVNKLPIAKLMTWGDGQYNFSRPVHWSLMLFGEEVIPGNMLGVNTDTVSYGHRFHHPGSIKVNKPADYVENLYAGKVIVEFAKRRAVILEQLQNIAAKNNVTPILPEDLLDEVTSIVEWPCAVFADFSKDFLQIPEEVIIESLQQHQKCFAVKDRSGKLAPHFITIANIESNNPASVKAGNEKVVKARLSDAAFFYTQDTKQPLESYALTLSKVVFHAKLGSIADKVLRVTKLSKYLATHFSLNINFAERASFLAKCDLLTGMVGEFPELQGVMGCYYSEHSGEAKEVSLAIKEQYYPRFAADLLPESTYGLVLSLADRMDTLVGLFAIGQKPNGVKDPYKLRRHALAVVRILLNTPKQLSLIGLINHAIDGFLNHLVFDRDELRSSLVNFIFERMLSFYQAQGVEPQYFNAVKVQQNEYLCDIDLRIQALLKYKEIPEAESLSAACKRVDNLLISCNLCLDNVKISEKLFFELAESKLYDSLVKIENQVHKLLLVSDYSGILQSLASLKKPLDAFFDNVMVMVLEENIKLNRLSLLKRLQKLLKTVADISVIYDFSA